MRIAVAGNKGSFSHQAGELYAAGKEFSVVEIVYAIDSAGVVKTMEEGQCELAMMPIHNTTGGLVAMTLGVIGKAQFEMLDLFEMNVEQCLMMHPEAIPEELMQIASHPQALKQCSQYLREYWPKRDLVEYQDTAQAAKDIAEGKLPRTTAAIAPKLSADIYGLTLLGEAIQDKTFNVTSWIVVKPL